MMLYGSGWNCSPFWGTVLDIYKTLSCKSFIQKKKKIPTYLPTSKMMGRSSANIQFFKDGLSLTECARNYRRLRIKMADCSIWKHDKRITERARSTITFSKKDSK